MLQAWCSLHYHAAGYTVTFDAAECHILDGTTVILKGGCNTTTNLWCLPLQPSIQLSTLMAAHAEAHTLPRTMPNISTEPQAVHNVHTIPHLQNRVKFMHKTVFCPPMQTLLCIANLGFLSTIPFLMPNLIHQHLDKSPATAKRQLKLFPSKYQSTQCIPKPTQLCQAMDIFCHAALANKKKGMFYTDCTRHLPA